MKVTYSQWRAMYICVECRETLNNWARMYSSGVCPYCGHRGKYAATIVESLPVVYRIKTIRSGPWWWRKTEEVIEFRSEVDESNLL